MCGIAGIISANSTSTSQNSHDLASQVDTMLRALVHRGPDAQGQFSQSPVFFGHRRLKILDLSDRANQPFTDGQDVLTFNGEIFNYQELRAQLETTVAFTTSSDTEVLFRALQTWGEAAVAKLEGQFAFAFYSRRNHSILLARDHVGICPLYLTDWQGNLCFASEIKPLLTLQKYAMDEQGVQEYLAYRYNVQSGRTLFAGIERFPPAHYLQIDLSTMQRTYRRYWRLEFSTQPKSIAQSEFDQILDGEIRRQSMSDVPVGLYLSGGIDSGAILKGYAKVSPRIQSFTLNFTDHDPDHQRVESLRAHLPIDPVFIEFRHRNLDFLRDTIRSLEEPFGDFITCANYTLAQTAAKTVKVVLSGEGGDEAFAGYDHQRLFAKMLRTFSAAPVRTMGMAALALMPPALLGKMKSYPGGFTSVEKHQHLSSSARRASPADAYQRLVCLFNDEELAKLLTPAWQKRVGPVDHSHLQNVFKLDDHPLQSVIRAEIEQLTLIVNLLKQDRMGMRFSLESRVPLVSRRILQITGSLPLGDLFGAVNKFHLMDYSGYPKIQKKPFSLFDSRAYLQTLAEMMDEVVLSNEGMSLGFFQKSALTTIREQARSGTILGVKRAMCLIVFILWWQAFRENLR